MKNIIFLVLASLLVLVVGEVRALSIVVDPPSYFIKEEPNPPDGLVIDSNGIVSLEKECEKMEWVIRGNIKLL